MNPLPDLHVERDGGAVIVSVSGELDIATYPDVEAAIRESFPSDATALVLDLTGVSFLDSSGVQMLFRLYYSLAHSRREMAIVLAIDARPRRAIEICDSVGLLRLCPTREDALRVIGGDPSAM